MAVVTGDRGAPRTAARAGFLYRPEVRQAIYQIVLVVVLAGLLYILVSNTAANLRRQNIASGFGFIDRTAGFDVSQSLIAYDNSMSYGRAFLVGLLNTLLVAGLGVVLATVRPDAAHNVPATLPGDLDRWLEASEITEAHGIELIEWFVIGPAGVDCPRELLGEPERW